MSVMHISGFIFCAEGADREVLSVCANFLNFARNILILCYPTADISDFSG